MRVGFVVLLAVLVSAACAAAPTYDKWVRVCERDCFDGRALACPTPFTCFGTVGDGAAVEALTSAGGRSLIPVLDMPAGAPAPRFAHLAAANGEAYLAAFAECGGGAAVAADPALPALFLSERAKGLRAVSPAAHPDAAPWLSVGACAASLSPLGGVPGDFAALVTAADGRQALLFASAPRGTVRVVSVDAAVGGANFTATAAAFPTPDELLLAVTSNIKTEGARVMASRDGGTSFSETFKMLFCGEGCTAGPLACAAGRGDACVVAANFEYRDKTTQSMLYTRSGSSGNNWLRTHAQSGRLSALAVATTTTSTTTTTTSYLSLAGGHLVNPFGRPVGVSARALGAAAFAWSSPMTEAAREFAAVALTDDARTAFAVLVRNDTGAATELWSAPNMLP